MIKRRKVNPLAILIIFLISVGFLIGLLVSILSATPSSPANYHLEDCSASDSLEASFPPAHEQLPELTSDPSKIDSSSEDSSSLNDDELPNEDTEREILLEPEDFSFENGIEGLVDLKEMLLDKINPLWGDYSIYVKNLDTNEYLVIHPRQQTPASLIKLFTLVYAFEKFENGSLERAPFIEHLVVQSIVVSCNNSFNQLLVLFGYGNLVQGAINATEFASSWGFEDTIVGGSLYPSYFEIVGFSNLYTSVLDVGHLLENIYRGTMVNEEASKEMLDILLAQQWLGKIPAGLPEGTVTANKTGEIGYLEHDAAIVFTDSANYILVIMTENAGFAIYNIQRISQIVYDYFATL